MLVRITIPCGDATPAELYRRSDIAHQLADDIAASPDPCAAADLRIVAEAFARAARHPQPTRSMLVEPFIADRRLP